MLALTHTPPDRRIPLGAFPHVVPAPYPKTPVFTISHRTKTRKARPAKPAPTSSKVPWAVGFHVTNADGRHLTGCAVFYAAAVVSRRDLESSARRHLRNTLCDTHPGFRLDGVCATRVESEAAR